MFSEGIYYFIITGITTTNWVMSHMIFIGTVLLVLPVKWNGIHNSVWRIVKK